MDGARKQEAPGATISISAASALHALLLKWWKPPVDNGANNPALFDAPSLLQPPKVSCVMVVNDEYRLKMARHGAVVSFLQQTYPNKELIIVNAIPESPRGPLLVTNREHPQIYERKILPRSDETIGSLRNLGHSWATGDWVCQWDDDDFSSPERLAAQMACRNGDRPVLLSCQIRVNMVRSFIFYHMRPGGIPRTALVPRRVHTFAYDNTSESEDGRALEKAFGRDYVVLDNREGRGTRLALALFHNRNASLEDYWCAPHSVESSVGRILVTQEDYEYTRDVCARYGAVPALKTDSLPSLTTVGAS